MDLQVLKKRISTYRSEKGRLTKVPDEIALEILSAWEQWSGPASGFYSEIGADFRKVAGILGRAKKLRRDGHAPIEEFKEIKLLPPPQLTSSSSGPIELVWGEGKIIRFNQIDLLLEFLKKAA